MKKERYIKVGNIHEIVRNKRERCNYVFTYEATGENYYVVGDKKLTIDEFHKMFPIDIKPPVNKGLNSDRTKNWINGEKSY